MTTAYNLFLTPAGSGENVPVGRGDMDEVALDAGVARGLKRTRLESVGDDSGVSGKGYKLYKPESEGQDFVDDGKTNVHKYQFGPEFQMRDLDTQSGGGIILTRPDNDTLRLSR